MTARQALDARHNAEHWLNQDDTEDTIQIAQAWALIAIAHELAELRKVLEAK